MRVDIHTHILPGIDDGSDSVETSVKMLDMLKNDGVTDVVLTPHFYVHNQNIFAFLQNRSNAFELLSSVCPDDIRLHIGAEVEFPDISIDYQEFRSLSIANGRYILIELPFVSSISSDTISRLERFIYQTELTPIIAHVERYPAICKKPETIAKLESIGCLIQVNANSVIQCKNGSLVDILLMTGQAHLLGTDCHNLTYRKPEYGKALDIIKTRYGSSCLDYLVKISESIIAGRCTDIEPIKIITKRLGRYR